MAKESQAIATMDFGGTTADLNVLVDYKPLLMENVHFSVNPNDLGNILDNIKNGFREVIARAAGLSSEVGALSFAFPGPADYGNGVIGALNNAPAFRVAGGVNLGKILTETFHLPVYINNDGDLFALGQLERGIVRELNSSSGMEWTITGVVGETLGSGWGCGLARKQDGMFIGSSSTGYELGVSPILIDGVPTRIESLVSRYGIVNEYNRLMGNNTLIPERLKTFVDISDPDGPKQIESFVGEESVRGNIAKKAWQNFGRYFALGNIWVSNLADPDVIVLGGGLSKAYRLFAESMMEQLAAPYPNEPQIRMLMKKPYNLHDPQQKEQFMKKSTEVVEAKKLGICCSSMSTADAIYAGAYAYAMQQMKGK